MEQGTERRWTSSTKDERKSLYQVVRAIMKAYDLSMDDVFEQAHGHKIYRSEHDDGNFRMGRIGHKVITPIYWWVIENHHTVAHQLEPELFDPAMLTNWDAFLQKHSEYGQLSITDYADVDPMRLPQVAAAGPSRHQPVDDVAIRLGEEFCFRLQSEVSGELLALQGYHGLWLPMVMNKNEITLTAAIDPQTENLPLARNGKDAKPLSELEEVGLHRFVFIVGEADIIVEQAKGLSLHRSMKRETLDRIAEAVTGSCKVYCLNQIFTDTPRNAESANSTGNTIEHGIAIMQELIDELEKAGVKIEPK